MKRNLVYFIVITTLILLFSCGIPNVYVPESSDITITRDSTSGTFTVTLSDTIKNELRDSSPTLYFLYTISSSDQSSTYSSAISSFNTSFASETSGSIITSSNPIYTYTSSDKSYSLYQLTRDNNAFNYQMGNDDSSLTLTLTRDTSENTLALNDSNGSTIYSEIKRFDDKIFTKDAGTGEIVDYEESGIYTVNVYLVISCSFTSYTNTYNKQISSSSPILSFQLD